MSIQSLSGNEEEKKSVGRVNTGKTLLENTYLQVNIDKGTGPGQAAGQLNFMLPNHSLHSANPPETLPHLCSHHP